MNRPDPSEHNEYYALYVNQVPDGDILTHLRDGVRQTVALFDGAPSEWATFRYADGKWTISELLGHMIDTEWVFSYRAMSIARGETVDLPGMDQDVYAANSNAGSRDLTSMLAELEAIRGATVALFAGFDPEIAGRQGHACGFPFTVRSFPWIIAGHEIHHRKVLEERYLVPLRG